MIAIGGVVERTFLIDDSDAGFMGSNLHRGNIVT